MIHKQEKYFSPLLSILRGVSIFVSYLIAAPLSFKVVVLTGNIFLPLPSPNPDILQLPFYLDRYLILFPLLSVLLVLFLKTTHSYFSSGLQNVGEFMLLPGISCLLSFVVFLLLMFVYAPLRTSLCFIILFHTIAWLLFTANRALVFWIIKHKQKKGSLLQFLLIVGTDKNALKAAEFFNKCSQLGIKVIGFLTFDETDIGKKFFNQKVMGTTEDLDEVLSKNVVDRVLYSDRFEEVSCLDKIRHRCEAEGIEFSLNISPLMKNGSHIFIEKVDAISILIIDSVFHSPVKLFFKRLIDITISISLIIVFLPFWIIIPIIIKRDSPGPAFYSQERVGKNGRLFSMYKFRSMVTDAEKMQEDLQYLNEMDGPVFKIKNDPRLTSTGRFLRKTSLDELPQLFNILKGNMSLVGPRPPIMKEVLQYRPWEKKRLSVIPGVTCLWQVTGRNEIKFDEWMKLDVQYIDNWSLSLDLKIILRTIPAVLSRKGAQ